MTHKTPAEEKGLKVGDVIWCNVDKNVSGVFTLIHDDATYSPLFKLVDGDCIYHLSNGERGTYLNLSVVFTLDRMTIKNTRVSLSELRRVKKIMRGMS